MTFELQGPIEYITMAASSKLIATCVTYPYQVVRARLQVCERLFEWTFELHVCVFVWCVCVCVVCVCFCVVCVCALIRINMKDILALWM